MRLGRERRVGLDERLAALGEAVELGSGRVPDELLAGARAVLRRTDERRARGDRAVVVALVGGTGTGKSSLFNVLAGAAHADVDVRRPTTGSATAWSVGDVDEATSLLDWLEVDPARRHRTSPGDAGRGFDGLVLVDLPDVDSVVATNRATADRLIERVDVLVWVVDPHKYAQRSLHEGYLARLREHAEVMVVVLNHVDRLDVAERRTCQADLERLVGGDHDGPQVLATSAVTGEGVDRLREVLRRTVEDQRAVAERIAADVRTEAGRLLEHVTAPRGSREVGGSAAATLDTGPLVSHLTGLADVDGFAEQGRRAYVAEARRRLRTPLLGLLQAITRIVRALAAGVGRVTRTGPPRPAAGRPGAARTLGPLDARHALLTVVERARRGLPWFWAEVVASAAERAGDALPTTVKAALAGIALEPTRRRWWSLAAAVWTAAELTVAVGVGWIVLNQASTWFGVPEVPILDATDRLTWPGLLVLVGTTVWLLVAAARRVGVRVGARRHHHTLRDHAHAAVAEAVHRTALAPLQAELDAFVRLRACLAVAAAS